MPVIRNQEGIKESQNPYYIKPIKKNICVKKKSSQV